MIELKNELSGYFTVSKGTDPDNMVEVASFPNLITDAGLLMYGASSDFIRYCNIGSSSTTPTVSDTTLINRLYYSESALSENTGANNTNPNARYVYRRRTMRFTPKGVPYTIAEVGYGWNTTGSVFNRALVVDGGGSPTTISVLDNEYIDITYELRLYPPTTDSTGTLTPTGKDVVPRNWTARAAGDSGNISYYVFGWSLGGGPGLQSLTAYRDNIGTLFSTPTGYVGSANTAGSYTINPVIPEITYSRKFELTEGNDALGIKSLFAIGYGYYYQIGFDAPFMKTNTDEITFTFKISWGRRP